MLYSPTALLDRAIEQLIEEKGEVVVGTFFDNIEALAIDGNRLIVKVESDLVKGILDQRFASEVNDIISDLAETRMRVEFSSSPAVWAKYTRPSDGSLPPAYAGYTFDSFIVGNSNKLAHAATLAVATAVTANGGTSSNPVYNPLFIYGQSGLGKTHLLYSVMEMVTTHRYDKRVVYIKGDDFTNDLVKSIGDGSVSDFREKYRGADVLLVDDIQFIAGKDRTQEEFFHTFNSLYEAGKQIILTSDRPPKEMATLESRLTTRFEWGLITDVQPPDLETRMALVNAKATKLNIELPTDIVEYIASSITNNVRQLEGVVKKITALHSMLDAPIDRKLAERAISDIFKESPGLNPTPDLILDEVSAFTGVEREKIIGISKAKDIVMARQILIYVLTEMTDLSLPSIGRFIGRDHTTAIYGRDKIAEKIKTDQALAASISDLQKNIRNK